MSKFELVEKSSSQYSTTFYLKELATRYTFQLINSPFSNCQIFSISPFYYLLFTKEACENIVDTIRDMDKLCCTRKPLCQVDIKEEYFNKIKDYIKIHAQMNYTNPTGSRMVQVLIDLR